MGQSLCGSEYVWETRATFGRRAHFVTIMRKLVCGEYLAVETDIPRSHNTCYINGEHADVTTRFAYCRIYETAGAL